MVELRGRINRRTYWEALIDSLAFIIVVGVLLPWLLLALYTSKHPNHALMYLVAAVLVLSVVLWIIFFADILKRRANDVGWYPWLLTILTILLPPMYIVLGCLPTQKGDNKYGPEPAPGAHLKNQTA